MDIIYYDDNIIVAIKPAGVISTDEPGGMPSLLRAMLGDDAAPIYTVHRLDAAVGGVMVWARTPKAAAELSRQVQEKALKKAYFAVCSGIPTPDAGEMRDLLFKDSVKQKSFAVISPRRGVKEALLD